MILQDGQNRGLRSCEVWGEFYETRNCIKEECLPRFRAIHLLTVSIVTRDANIQSRSNLQNRKNDLSIPPVCA